MDPVATGTSGLYKIPPEIKGAGAGTEGVGADIAGSADTPLVDNDSGSDDSSDDNGSGAASVTVVEGNDDESSRNSDRAISSSEADFE